MEGSRFLGRSRQCQGAVEINREVERVGDR